MPDARGERQDCYGKKSELIFCVLALTYANNPLGDF